LTYYQHAEKNHEVFRAAADWVYVRSLYGNRRSARCTKKKRTIYNRNKNGEYRKRGTEHSKIYKFRKKIVPDLNKTCLALNIESCLLNILNNRVSPNIQQATLNWQHSIFTVLRSLKNPTLVFQTI
jgi:hypothetical protein